MKKILTLSSICMLLVLFNCTTPSGETVTMTFPDNTYYSRLYVSDGMKVTVTDKVDEIVITGDANVLEKLTVENTYGRLRIFRRDVSMMYLTPTEVLLPYNPDLREVDVEMDSEFYTPYGLEGDEVKITVGGRSEFEGYVYAHANLTLDLETNSEAKMSLDMDDGGKLYLEMDRSSVDIVGYAPFLYLDMSKESLIEDHTDGIYYTLECDRCSGKMSNSTAHLHCYDEIDVEMSYGSMIYYTGSDVTVYYDNVDDSSDIVYQGGDKKAKRKNR